MSNKLLTPVGVRDYFGRELEYKKFVETKVHHVFHKYGYHMVETPTLEYIDLYNNGHEENLRDIYKFIDKDDEVLTLRSDMTPAICRHFATFYNKSDIPKRFSYIEKIFRTGKNYQGIEKEFTGAGAELIGVENVEGEAEIVSLAINSIISTGLEDFKIDIGNVNFLKGILENSNFDCDISEKIEKFLIKGDFVEAEKIVNANSNDDKINKFFSILPILNGDISVLDKALEYVNNDVSKAGLLELRNLYKDLENYGLEKYISFDLSMIGQFSYYTGLVFHGYSKEVGYSIVDGGRYDTLLENFDISLPSVGFSIKINGLLEGLIKQNGLDIISNDKTLIILNDESKSVAYKIINELREKDLVVELLLLEISLDEAVDYAKKNEFGGILNFINDNDVEIISIETLERNKVSINDFMKGV